MLRSLTLLFGAAMFALVPTSSLGGTPQQAAPPPAPAAPATPAAAPVNYPANPVKPTPESQAKAKALYKMDCALCHGDNGNGKTEVATGMGMTMPDWSDAKTLAGKQDGELFQIIRNGKDKMPPEAAARANDTEVWNLVIYIRSFSKP